MASLLPAGWVELARERRADGAPVAGRAAHRDAALDWLARAQDATPDDGFARGYSLSRNAYFGARGWQPSYPETTGYIIPTFYLAARVLGRSDLAARAERAARWACAVQLESGAIQGGVIGEGRSPAIFNTGQILFGWLSAHAETGDAVFADAARRAAHWLCDEQAHDGSWAASRFARSGPSLYNARSAWGLAAVGRHLDEPRFLECARRNLRFAASQQHANGWFPWCCLSDDDRPLLHTLAYAIRGLFEGGRILGDEDLVDAATLAAERIAACVRDDGWLPGRFHPDWRPAARWSCLTGDVQMANIWLRLHAATGDQRWMEPARAAIDFVTRSQSLDSRDPGLRGGVRGSKPMTGEYGRFQVLNWATKFYVDALLRDELRDTPGADRGPHEEFA